MQKGKFRPAVEVQEAMKEEASFTKKHLVRSAKRHIPKKDNECRLVELQSLPNCVHMN